MDGYCYHKTFWWQHEHFDSKRIWIESKIRVKLIKKGIDKVGSINGLGRLLGYRSRIHPGWSVRQILLGYQPFTLERLAKLANYVEWPLEDILNHRVDRAQITIEKTNMALKEQGLWCYMLR